MTTLDNLTDTRLCRLADRPEDLARLDLDPDSAQPPKGWLRSDIGPGSYEWWYRDDGSSLVLRAWFRATGERREVAYLAYRAALAREEASARDLERLWHLASTCHEALVGQVERVAE